MARAATKRSSRNCSATAPIAAPPQSAASPIRFPPSRPVLPVPIATMDPTVQRNDEGGETAPRVSVATPRTTKKVEQVESRRDGTPVATQTRGRRALYRMTQRAVTGLVAHFTLGDSRSAAF